MELNLFEAAAICKNRLKNEQLNDMVIVDKIYPVKISNYYLKLAMKSEAIFKQAFPVKEELIDSNLCEFDPLDENRYQVISGLIHKYKNKAIILTTNRCFMNCRHCTRKRLMHSGYCFEQPNFERIFNYIEKHNEINDILLTGGDALSLDNTLLFDLINNLNKIGHINTIRIGTRAPVTFPARITKALCDGLGLYSNIWINTQFNHPDEITEHSKNACKLIQEKGIPICNQTVILKGINDNYDTLRELFLKLVNIRVIPYYLYQCDNVKGVSHFITSPELGANVIKRMRQELPGMAVPRYVIDTQNKMGKIIAEYSNIVKLNNSYVELSVDSSESCIIKYDPSNFPKNE